MQVKIKDNAKQTYINYMTLSCQPSYSEIYCKIMERLQGRVCEVDTKHLFKTSFNVIDPDDSSKIIGVRWVFCDVVGEDIRLKKMKCNWCGKTQDIADKCCECDRKEYTERLLLQKT